MPRFEDLLGSLLEGTPKENLLQEWWTGTDEGKNVAGMLRQRLGRGNWDIEYDASVDTVTVVNVFTRVSFEIRNREDRVVVLTPAFHYHHVKRIPPHMSRDIPSAHHFAIPTKFDDVKMKTQIDYDRLVRTISGYMRVKGTRQEPEKSEEERQAEFDNIVHAVAHGRMGLDTAIELAGRLFPGLTWDQLRNKLDFQIQAYSGGVPRSRRTGRSVYQEVPQSEPQDWHQGQTGEVVGSRRGPYGDEGDRAVARIGAPADIEQAAEGATAPDGYPAGAIAPDPEHYIGRVRMPFPIKTNVLFRYFKSKLGRRPWKRVPNIRETLYVRYTDGGIGYLYRSTPIAIAYPNKVVLSAGGWVSNTTSSRFGDVLSEIGWYSWTLGDLRRVEGGSRRGYELHTSGVRVRRQDLPAGMDDWEASRIISGVPFKSSATMFKSGVIKTDMRVLFPDRRNSQVQRRLLQTMRGRD
jgi:hypothetical protein